MARMEGQRPESEKPSAFTWIVLFLVFMALLVSALVLVVHGGGIGDTDGLPGGITSGDH
jgi:hypothetical protein